MRKLKIQRIVIAILVALLILTWIAIGIVKSKTKQLELAVIQYNHRHYAMEYVDCNLTKQEIRDVLDDIYGVSYIYYETNYLGEDVDGIAESKPNRISVLDSLDNETYIIVLSHELTHLKYQTSNETFTEYKSLTTLYETNIEVFKKAALNKVKFIIGGGYDGKEIDCGYYLLNYFKEVLNER